MLRPWFLFRRVNKPIWKPLESLWCSPQREYFTVKPPDLEHTQDELGNPLPQGSPLFVKRKARLVISGNFQGRQAREDSYAGGRQTESLRAMLVLAARRGWRLASTDIRNAFF